MSKTIVIDAGHGGHDPGAVSNGLKEKDLTLTIAKKIHSNLKQYDNIKVIMTRQTDKFVTLTERANIANRNEADAFLSVHINKGDGNGFESYIYNGSVVKSTHTLQEDIHSSVMEHIDSTDRGEKRANLAVLRLTSMSALLTENLFIDSNDADKLKEDSFLEKLAQGHVDGILQYFDVEKEKPGNSTAHSDSEEDEDSKEIQKADPSHAKAWKKASNSKNNIFNGQHPREPLTREQAATVLDKLGLLK